MKTLDPRLTCRMCPCNCAEVKVKLGRRPPEAVSPKLPDLSGFRVQGLGCLGNSGWEFRAYGFGWLNNRAKADQEEACKSEDGQKASQLLGRMNLQSSKP